MRAVLVGMALLLAACGQRHVEPVYLDFCQSLLQRYSAMTPEELKRDAEQQKKRWGVMVHRTGFAGADMSTYWCLNCKTGHREECMALPQGE